MSVLRRAVLTMSGVLALTGVAVPAPVAYLGDVDGRGAFAMERVGGETIGRLDEKIALYRSMYVEDGAPSPAEAPTPPAPVPAAIPSKRRRNA